jgi:hypothetical protein
MFSFDHSSIRTLANLTDQHIILAHWVLLFKVVLGNDIVLRLVLLVILLIGDWGLDLLLAASRHRVHLIAFWRLGNIVSLR